MANQYANAAATQPRLPPDFAEFAPRAGYKVEPDGRVYTITNGAKSYVPPWIVWQNSATGRTADGMGLTDEGRAYRTPGSDPSSAWNFMFENSGPFRKQSQWDNEKGTYKGSVDWGTLLGTIGAGGLIGAGVAAAVSSGAAAGSSAPAFVGPVEATAGGGAATTGAVAPAALAGGSAAATGGSVASWLTPSTANLITTGIGAAGQIYGANKAADASSEAAAIQAASFEKALAQEKQEQDYQHSQDLLKQNQYADYLSRLNPYAQTGQAANNRLSQFMGQPTTAQTPLTPAPAPNPLPAQRTTIPVTPAQQSSANSFVPTAVKNNPTASQVPQVPGPYANMPIYEAPDGSRRRVPPDQEAAALAAGAKRVG